MLTACGALNCGRSTADEVAALSALVEGFAPLDQHEALAKQLRKLQSLKLQDTRLRKTHALCVEGYAALVEAGDKHAAAATVVNGELTQLDARSRAATERVLAEASQAITRSRRAINRCLGKLSQARLTHRLTRHTP